jgi:hypothetical protein
LALLQEEAIQDEPIKRFESSSNSKKNSNDNVKNSGESYKLNSKPNEDKKAVPSTLPKPGEDKITALKNYRRSKGLCFKCGEKWGPQHKCSATVSLNAMEQLWACITDGEKLEFLSSKVEADSDDELMALSVQALSGTEGIQTIILKAYLKGREVFMLVDSGSSHSFINDQLVSNMGSRQLLSHPVKVQVANGELLHCTHQLSNQLWGIQGYSFNTTLKIIPLKGYDVILGMDWLGTHSPMEIHWADKWL